jgi:transcription elongation factor GreA
MHRIPLTPEGHKRLEDELEKLIKVERPANIQAIAEARAHGDLSENAEYHAAKERQGFIEGRIQDLKAKISQAEIIDPSRLNHEHVAFGAKVTLLDLETDAEITYMLVGPEEADVKAGKISLSSPVGKSLIGKKEGDEIHVQAPGRTVEYEIMDIIYE